jgi:predicted transcriptional regulator
MRKFLKGEESPKMKMVIAADGETEIDFPDLEDTDEPAVGDTATVDGTAAEGEYLMPSGDTYVFTAGELTEIRTADGDEDEESEEMKTLRAENEQLKEQVAEMKAIKASSEKNAKALKDSSKLLQEVQAEMKEIKAAMSSDFKSEGEDGNGKKPSNTTSKSRKVFKD